MNMMQLFQCLTVEEKKQLLNLLTMDRDEKRKQTENMTVLQWCEAMQPTTRLRNCLNVLFHQGGQYKRIVDVTKDDLMQYRNAGVKCWQEFIELRGY